MDSKKRNYIPDFILNESIIVEVKNKNNQSEKAQKYKEDGVKIFMNENPKFKEYVIMDETNIPMDDEILYDDYIKGNLIIDSGKKDKFLRKIKRYL
jgi:hypothetical protein